MDAAAKHENRYRAVIEYANGAMFNVAELDAWAASKKVPVSFETLLKDERIADNYSAEKHFIHFSILSVVLVSRLVPQDMDPSDATTQLMADGDDGSYAEPVRRMRDLVMVRYDRLLLSAVYDGDLNLYDPLMFTKLDVRAARLRYESDPAAYVQPAVAQTNHEHGSSAAAQPETAHVSEMVELTNNSEEFIDWDYWAGKMPRWTAFQAVRLLAALDPGKHPDLSFRRNETAGAAKEHAKRLETLAASHGMTEAAPLEWLQWADRLNEPGHCGCRNAVTPDDHREQAARHGLAKKYERLDRIADALVTLSANVPPSGTEARYRQLLGMTRWLESLGLQYRFSNGVPASQPKGVLVTEMDVRECQYLAVADVRTAAIASHCWPIEEQEAAPVLPVAHAPQPAAAPDKGNERFEAMVEFARMHAEEEQRLQRTAAEFPEFGRETELVSRAVVIGEATARAHAANKKPSALDLSLVGKTDAEWHAMSTDERARTRNNIALTRRTMQQAEQERARRHAAGRYTLLEAAGFIARATHTNTDTVLGEMRGEAESYGLPVYMPRASNACAWPNQDYGDLCHVLAGDLNRFIDKYHPGDFRFPEPQTVSADESRTAVQSAAAATIMTIVQHSKAKAQPVIDAIFLGRAARELAIMEVGKDKDDGIIWAYERKWQAVIDHLLGRRELPLLARVLEGESASFEPTTELQGAWVAKEELRRVFEQPPREVIEKLELKRRQDAEERAKQDIARRAAGRCTIREAAEELAEKTGWDEERWVKTIVDAILANELPAQNPKNPTDALPYTPTRINGPYPIREYYEQVSQDNVNKLLDAHPEWRVNYRFVVLAALPARETPQVASRPPLQQRHQEEEILRVIKGLGHNSKMLPKQKAGTPGVKSSVRQKLSFSKKVFDLAWERLRKSGEIADA